MRVTIRKEEIKAILSAYFRVEVDDFIIGPAEPSAIGKVVRIMVVKPLDISEKIGNIRALRDISVKLGKPITLQEGNWAMTHWLEWISFVDEYNRLPLSGYGLADTFGKLK
jgi:hypothetical protein